jgi:hypothetical protein
LNTAAAIIPMNNARILYLTFLAAGLIVIFIDRMWKKLPPDHPVVYSSS